VAAHWRGLGTHQLTGGQVHARLRERFTRVAGANRAGYELEVFIAPAALGRVGRRAVG
jgi:hypothetical protein